MKINLSKKANRPAPIPYKEAENILDDMLQNAQYDKNYGLLQSVPLQKTIVVNDYQGNEHAIKVQILVDNFHISNEGGSYSVKNGSIRLIYNEFLALSEAGLLPSNAASEAASDGIYYLDDIKFKELPKDKVIAARKEFLLSNLLHELTHAADPSLHMRGAPPYAKYEQRIMTTNDKEKQLKYFKEYEIR
jgi:hypothetical protein